MLRLSRRHLFSSAGALAAVLPLRAARPKGTPVSQPITTLDLTGATTNQSATISWALQSVGAAWQELKGGSQPYLELVNMSACLVQIKLPRSGSVMPLPPGTWHIFPLDPQETGYTYTVLNAQQNAANNKVYGWYYAAYEEPPKTGQVVNQSQALAAPAQLYTQTVGLFGVNSQVIVLGPSTTAASFQIQSVTVSFAQNPTPVGIGRSFYISITDVGTGATVWRCGLQEEHGTYFFPINAIVANSIPGTVKVNIVIATESGGNFLLADGYLSVVASIV